MRVDDTATVYAVRRATPSGAAAAGVLAAVWCRSVGTSWTLELHEVDGGTARGTVVDWINSGIPISQPEPDMALTPELLGARGMYLFGDPSAGPDTHSRRGIGYACPNAELITLAHLVADAAAEAGVHPVLLAARWVEAGFSTDDAAGWILRGVQSPQAALRQTVSQARTHVTDRIPTPGSTKTCQLNSKTATSPPVRTRPPSGRRS